MEPILSASNISKSFIGVRALNNIDITINAGEIHCLAGENGCGKSTLVKCISGVYTPDEGTIPDRRTDLRVDDTDRSHEPWYSGNLSGSVIISAYDGCGKYRDQQAEI